MEVENEFMLDGNAVAGLFTEIFGVEMTASPMECAGCGTENEMGALLLFTQAPGVVMRCPRCENVVVRVVVTPRSVLFDARGAVYVQIPRPSARASY
jgi:hypothetical protein